MWQNNTVMSTDISCTSDRHNRGKQQSIVEECCQAECQLMKEREFSISQRRG